MQRLIRTTILAFALGCTIARAGTVPTTTVTNKSDSMVQIVPLDEAHRSTISAPLDQIRANLPPGAFILTNRTSIPINVVVSLWSYQDRNGQSQQRRMNCDGYLAVPSEPIVKANDSVLITPGGCTMREHFVHMAAGGAMIANPLRSERNKSVFGIAGNLTEVRITVDSIIFADGRIWGPDALHYYTSVAARYWAVRSVVEEISAARANGLDTKSPLEKIRAETEGKGDQPSYLRRYYAGLLQRSPNPEGTLKLLSEQPVLPEFQHIGETK